MIDAILDTTVVLHLYRKYQPALVWFNNQQRYGVTSITWLEVMEGASNKVNQAQCKSLLSQFDLLYLTSTDQQWAMQQLEHFQFSHHIGKDDCLKSWYIDQLDYQDQLVEPYSGHFDRKVSPYSAGD